MGQALPLLEAADEQDVQGAVAQLLVGLGGLKGFEVDAVRDDLVLAREIAVDEVACSTRDRDPAVELVGEPPGELRADPVRRRETAEGVKRADVHRFGRVEHRRGEERHERLVEVEDVEPLLVEHLTRLLLEAQAERHATDRPVCRCGPSGAEANDVTIALPLAAVLRRDDPHVVAHPAHRLVRESHVLVDAPGMRVAVRADDPDLQGLAAWTLTAASAAGAADCRSDVTATLRWAAEYAPGGGAWRAADAGRRRRCGGATSTARQGASSVPRWPRDSRPRSSRGTRSTRCRCPPARGRRSCRRRPGQGPRR